MPDDSKAGVFCVTMAVRLDVIVRKRLALKRVGQSLGGIKLNSIKTVTALVFVTCSSAAPLRAAEWTEEERIERFQLFNECKAFDFSIADLGSEAEKIGVTNDAVQAAVESRLRAARLYDSANVFLLKLDINLVGGAFHIRLNFFKPTIDLATKEPYVSATWGTGFTGIHGGNSGFVTSSLAQVMDYFLVEFLRVNEDACGAN